MCSARCVGIPDGLRDIEAPVRKDDDDEREEEQEKEEAPAVREEAVHAVPVEDDLVLEEDDLAPNEDPAVDDAGSDAPGESPPGESPPAIGVTTRRRPNRRRRPRPHDRRRGGIGRRTERRTRPRWTRRGSSPGESPTVDDLLEQLSARWRSTSAENARLRSDVDRLEEECGYLREALRAARVENDALRAGGTTTAAAKHAKTLVEPPRIEPAAEPSAAPPRDPGTLGDPRLATAASRVEDAVAGLWRSRGDPRSPKPPSRR